VVSPFPCAAVVAVDFATDMESCLFRKCQVIQKLIGICNFLVSCLNINSFSLGSRLSVIFEPHDSCKYVHTISLLEFCAVLLAEWSVQKVHVSLIFVDFCRFFLSYSHSFLAELRPPGSWFVIHGPSIF
jgi:hypothetical protein